MATKRCSDIVKVPRSNPARKGQLSSYEEDWAMRFGASQCPTKRQPVPRHDGPATWTDHIAVATVWCRRPSRACSSRSPHCLSPHYLCNGNEVECGVARKGYMRDYLANVSMVGEKAGIGMRHESNDRRYANEYRLFRFGTGENTPDCSGLVVVHLESH